MRPFTSNHNAAQVGSVQFNGRERTQARRSFLEEIHEDHLQEHLSLSVRLRRIENECEEVGVTDLSACDAESVKDIESADERLKSKKVVVLYDQVLQSRQRFRILNGGFVVGGHRKRSLSDWFTARIEQGTIRLFT